MNNVFIWRTRTCIYEIDAFGHVNNAVYWNYLHQATTVAHPNRCQRLRRVQIEYLAPAFYGDELEVLAWPESRDQPEQRTWGYLIRRPADGRELVVATATWAGDEAEAMPHPPPVTLRRPKPLRLTNPIASSHTFHWQHTVREYEIGPDGLVSPVVYLQWIEEAKFSAAASVGWPPERMTAADFVTVQLQHETEWYDALGAGAEVTILSRLVELRRLKGTWRHEVYGAGRLVAVDHSHGAFLNRAGQPHPAPPALLTALLTGQTDVG